VPTAALNGIDVHDERAGDGPPLLFLNSSGSLTEAAVLADDVGWDRSRVLDEGGHVSLHQDRRGFPDVIEFLLGAGG
jgi:hypothetical protein